MGKRVGLRTIKTAISIFICLMIFMLLKTVELIPGVPADFAFKWYNPFFAGIATAYSVYPGKKKSMEQAKNRCVASLIGGIIGIILVSVYELIGGRGNWPTLAEVSFVNFILPYTLTALVSIVVVVVGVALKQQPAVFVSILTFLSVTVNPNATISNTWGQWVFGLNRILSTVIGVLVALAVNCFRLPHRHCNKDLLFCIGIEGILEKDTDKIKGFMNYKLNNVVYLGVNCTLFTTRTPTTFMHLLEDVKINHPVICCSGAALYDTEKLTYLYKEEILAEDAAQIDEYLDSKGITPFKNYIVDDVLHIYCKKIDNIGERLYMESKKNAAYCSFDIGQIHKEQNILYYLIVERIEKVNQIVEDLTHGPLQDKILIQIYDYFDHSEVVPELKYIKIYSKKIEELNVLKQYCRAKDLRIVGLTTSPLSNHLLKNSDIALTYYSNTTAKDYADIILNTNSYDEMFRQISKLYYSKKYQRVESQVDINE